MKYELTVFGKAQPAGSKRGFPIKRKSGGMGVSIVDANPKASSWKAQIAHEAQLDALNLILGPVRLDVTFYIQRPQGHFGSGKNVGKIKDSAPAYPIVKPDRGKLLRAVEDALTGVIYRDDNQVVSGDVRKKYAAVGDRERTEITVSWDGHLS